MVIENGIVGKGNYSCDWELILLFGRIEISTDKCNKEPFLMFGRVENSTKILRTLFNPNKTTKKYII